MKLQNVLQTLVFGAMVTTLAACSPSPAQMKKLMTEHPDILHAAIEADPKAFFEVVQKVQGAARDQQMAEQMKEELVRVENDMKTPKKVSIDEGRPAIGPANAKVTIVEWADFNCGHCTKAHETMEKLVAEYKDNVRIVFKHLPILSKESRIAAEFMEAISLQDKEKALKFHAEVFAKQNDLRKGGEEFLKKLTAELGADVARVQKDRKGDVVKKRIAEDEKEAKEFAFNGTPGFMINGAAIHGAYPYEFFKQVVDKVVAQ